MGVPVIPLPELTISALIFDFDGTLVDTRAANHNALRATFAPHGIRPEDMHPAPQGTGFVDRCAQLIAEGLLSPDASIPELQAICERETLRALADVREIPAVAELARWADGRFGLAIATGSTQSIVEHTLTATGLRDLFGVIVTRDQVENGKPAPDLFLRASRLLDVQPAGCVVLEDTDVGLAAAEAAGMTAIDVRPYREPG